MKILTKILLVAPFLLLNSFSQTWMPVNNPGGGKVLDLFVHSNGEILAGTLNGPFSSSDDGLNWTSKRGNINPFAASQVVMNSSGDYIWQTGFYLYLSTDNGSTWTDINNGTWQSGGDVLLNNNDDIFVGTYNDNVWRSTDNGSNWTQLTNIPGAEALGINSQQILFASRGGKIYSSSDNGDNWEIIYTDPNSSNTVRQFAFDDSDNIYGVIFNNGVIRSTDTGNSWNYINNNLPLVYTLTIAVNSDDHIFVGKGLGGGVGGGVYRSTDGGNSWADFSTGLIDSSIQTINVSAGGDLLLGTSEGGVYRRSSSSSQWISSSNGLQGVNLYLIRARSDGDLFAGTNAGVYRSTDGAQTWSWSITGFVDRNIEYLEIHPDGSLYAADGDKIYRSSDNGTNWINVTGNIPGGEVEVQGIAFTSSGDVFITTDGFGVLRSTDNGQNWNNVNNGLPDPDVRDIISNSNDVLFVSDGISVYRSTDSGSNWIEILNQLPDGDVEEFGIGQNDVLFAATYSDGLFRSTDNGDNWTLTLDTDIITIDANGSEIFAGSELILGGVYFSADNGLTWSEVNDGLPSLQIESLTYRPGDKLYAVVRDNGIYSGDIATGLNDPENSIPNQFTLNQNYPNPFNPSTKISWQLPIGGHQSLKIYDVLGKEIATLVNEEKPAGSYEVRFDAAGLSSGIYFYQLTAGDFKETKKNDPPSLV